MSKVTHSLRAAVDAYCKSCICDPKCGLGGWRESVQGCEIRRCALWPHRPMARVRSAEKATNSLAFSAMPTVPGVRS